MKARYHGNRRCGVDVAHTCRRNRSAKPTDPYREEARMNASTSIAAALAVALASLTGVIALCR